MNNELHSIRRQVAELRKIGGLLNKDRLVAHGILHQAELCLDNIAEAVERIEEGRASVTQQEFGFSSHTERSREMYRELCKAS